MSTPGEHKTVQARILAYAKEIGWSFVSREEAKRRRRFEPQMGAVAELPKKYLRKSAKSADGNGLSWFFDDLLDTKVREFHPRYAETVHCPAAAGFRHLHTKNYGNRDFLFSSIVLS